MRGGRGSPSFLVCLGSRSLAPLLPYPVVHGLDEGVGPVAPFGLGERIQLLAQADW